MEQHFLLSPIEDGRSFWDVSSSLFLFGKNSVSRRLFISKKEKALKIAFLIFSTISLLFCLAWLYSWSVLSNDYLTIEEYMYNFLNFWFRWYILILVVSVFICTYLAIVVFASFIQMLYNRPLKLCLCHKIILPFCILTCVVLFVVASLAWPDSEQWHSISASFDVTSPFLQLVALIFWVLFAMFIVLNLHSVQNTKTRFAVGFFYSLILLFLLTLPFWLYSPCIGKDLEALVKPLVIGHRGAPALAPENTLLSFKKAVEQNVYAVESDVRVSLDGVAFLMHDDTLFRTTNVAEVFPQRKHDRAETFTWPELRQLNAGEWYLRIDPFSNKARFNQSEREEIEAQKIPSFEEFVSFAADSNVSIIFDLFQPFNSNDTKYLNAIFRTLLTSNLPSNDVIYPLRNVDNWIYYRNITPHIRLMSYHVLPNASAYTIDIFNLPYGIATDESMSFNASVIEYVVDANWGFSRAWCQGAWAVTTNYCSFLMEMTEPSWVMSVPEYFLTWTGIDILALVTLTLIWYYCRKKVQIEKVQQISRVFDVGF